MELQLVKADVLREGVEPVWFLHPSACLLGAYGHAIMHMMHPIFWFVMVMHVYYTVKYSGAVPKLGE